MSFAVASLGAVSLVALVHIFGSRLRFSDEAASDRWLSAFGGASTAFLFLILLPKLMEAQPLLAEATGTGFYGYVVHRSYILALFGFTAFYGVERLVLLSNQWILKSSEMRGGRRNRVVLVAPVFYAQAAGLALYCWLVGYLISTSSGRGLSYVLLFTLAMALHFLATDYVLRHKLGEAYDSVERWLFAVAMLAGWATAQLTEVTVTTLALWDSFFAGALVFLVVKEEVPTPEGGRFRPFLVGALAYSVLVLLMV